MISDLLAGLNEEEVRLVGEGSQTLELQGGQTVYSPGDSADSLFIVYQGEIEILPEGSPSIPGGIRLKPGDFFGELALLQGRSHTSSAVAVIPTSLLELRWEILDKLMESNPQLLRNLNAALADRLRETDRRTMAALAKRALENEQLFGRVSAALSVSRQVNDLLSWEDLWRRLLDIALATLNAERGTVYLYNPKTAGLDGQTIRGDGLDKISLLEGQGIAGACASSGEPYLVPDAQEDEHFAPEWDAMSGFTSRAMICSPFRDNAGNMLGVIQLINSTPDSFNAEDLACLVLIAEQLALGFERAKAVKEMVANAGSKVAETITGGITRALNGSTAADPLTNARTFAKLVELAWLSGIEPARKPIRCKTFAEKVAQTLGAMTPERPPNLISEGLYSGFFTADPDMLQAALEGLALDINGGSESGLVLQAIDKGESLEISLDGSIQFDWKSNPPLSFSAARRTAELHGGRFWVTEGAGGQVRVGLSLPLSG